MTTKTRTAMTAGEGHGLAWAPAVLHQPEGPKGEAAAAALDPQLVARLAGRRACRCWAATGCCSS
ncbi:hypothetical protein JQS43_22020 [Natronosporangium hydrolyticum]|uniref:Uncharacterized protein n=1 Tax=Natronosporangium hydrolyticum TaxID=2811111 RepID=A0A895YJ68_9ACTN|nr:hypothetical protein [Natronosporangium hydrolyticum]QSB14170.1 hypothetical protein JQS43_22020 [Natronosporangium hydrolyticum]